MSIDTYTSFDNRCKILLIECSAPALVCILRAIPLGRVRRFNDTSLKWRHVSPSTKKVDLYGIYQVLEPKEDVC